MNMIMTLNDYRDEAWKNAEEHGFHEKEFNLGERLMLVVSELSEALEADRKGMDMAKAVYKKDAEDRPHYQGAPETCFIPEVMTKEDYQAYVRGTLPEEIADTYIRLFDLAGCLKIDLNFHVRAKMHYNKQRPRLHGKGYG